MKKILFATILAYGMAPAQNLDVKRHKQDEYSASNGKTYHIGDAIKLGRGSDTDGRFNYLQAGGFMNTMAFAAQAASPMSGAGNAYALSGERNMAGQNVIIKKIKRETSKRGGERVFFVVGGGTVTNLNLFIEDAIATCEIEDCNKKPTDVNIVGGADKYDQLEKLKKLKDSGVLSDAEYDAEKSKLLK